MTNFKQTKLIAAVFLLNLCQSSINASEPTKDETPAAAAKPEFVIIDRDSALASLAALRPSASHPAVSGTSVASLRPAMPSQLQTLTDEELDAKAAQEFGRDIRLSAMVTKFDQLFRQAAAQGIQPVARESALAGAASLRSAEPLQPVPDEGTNTTDADASLLKELETLFEEGWGQNAQTKFPKTDGK